MTKIAAIAGVLWLACGSVTAGAQEYAFDISKKYPAAFKAWQKIVPPRFRKQIWIFRLEGTGSPIGTVSSGGLDFLYGSDCKPHDCGGNFVAFLLSKDGSSAFGVLNSTNLHADRQFFGAPDADQQALLLKALEN